MSCHEFRNILEVFHDGHNVWELAHIDCESLCVVDLGWQEGICESQNIAQTVPALGLLDNLLEGSQTAGNSPLRPRVLVLVAEPLAHLLEHGQVLDRLRSGIDHLAKTTHLEPLMRVLWQKLSLAWIDLFKVLTDCHGFAQRYWLLSDVFVLDDHTGHHLDNRDI